MDMDTGYIVWSHFSPISKGGSFGREDLGEFCRIGTNLFIVPLFEHATSTISKQEIETKIERILPDAKKNEVFELYNGDFVLGITTDWPNKFQSSLLTESNWK